MLGDGAEAQDVAQETFCRLWAHRAALNEPRTAAAWLYRTSTRLAVDRLRSLKRNRHDLCEAFAPAALSGSPEADAAWRQLLHRTRLAAPHRELEVVLLSRVDGLAQAEIGEVLGVSERTVRRLLRRFDRRVNHAT